MHRAQVKNKMNETAPTKPSKIKPEAAFVVRVNLKKLLTESEQKSFAEQAAKHGRTIREHFIAITLGNKTTAA